MLQQEIDRLFISAKNLQTEVAAKKTEALAQFEQVELCDSHYQKHMKKASSIGWKVFIACAIIAALDVIMNLMGFTTHYVFGWIACLTAILSTWRINLFSRTLRKEYNDIVRRKKEVLDVYTSMSNAYLTTKAEFDIQVGELRKLMNMLPTLLQKHLHLLDPSPLPEEVREDVMDYLADLATCYASVEARETDNSLSLSDLQKHLQKKEVMN